MRRSRLAVARNWRSSGVCMGGGGGGRGREERVKTTIL